MGGKLGGVGFTVPAVGEIAVGVLWATARRAALGEIVGGTYRRPVAEAVKRRRALSRDQPVTATTSSKTWPPVSSCSPSPTPSRNSSWSRHETPSTVHSSCLTRSSFRG